MKRPYAFLAVGLCWLLCLDSVPPRAVAQNAPERIHIAVLEGEGVINSFRQRVARDLVVKVQDEDGRPLSGASVVFALPLSGASGEFQNRSTNLTVVTDNAGVAAARGLRTNQIAGRMQVYVTASYHGLRAQTSITQFIEPGPGATGKTQEPIRRKSGGKWKWIALGAAAAAGAGAGVYFGTRSQSSPISVTTGPVVFGSPR